MPHDALWVIALTVLLSLLIFALLRAKAFWRMRESLRMMLFIPTVAGLIMCADYIVNL